MCEGFGLSLESARKLGLTASLMYVLMPIISAVIAVVLVLSIIAAAVTRTGPGTVAPNIFSGGLLAFSIAVTAVGVASLVLFLLAMYRLSHYYNEPAIFNNIFYAFILSLISGIVLVALQFTVIASLLSHLTPTGTPTTVFAFAQLIIVYLVVLGVALVFGIVNAVLYMRAFNKLAEKSGVDNFKTAGLLYLIGTLLTIVLIGGILVWIAWIFAAMGFNKLKAATPTVSYPPPPPLFSAAAQSKRCPNCGTENNADALFCRTCGNTLH